jgi:Na+-translocating ferredoxin:NAD+ oxidoreductase RnfG subunit
MEKDVGIREVLAIILVLVGGTLFLILTFTSKSITEEEVKKMKSICDNLIPPPSFLKTHQSDVVKSSHAVRGINYSSIATPKEVEEHYVKLLTKSGWQYTKEEGGIATYLRFKRDKYNVSSR